jgi:hypothetical protein
MDENSNPIDFFQRYPLKIKLVDVKLDINAQVEYFSLLAKALRKYSNEASVEALMEQAFDAGVPLEERKLMLVRLSCSEEVEVLRALEQHEKNCSDEEIKDILTMCVYQCRNGVESALLGEQHAVLVSGMGGKDNKIRYFAALATLSGQPWTTTEQHLLREELLLASKEHDAVVEMLEFSGKYAKILLLTPITLSPITVVRNAKDASNALGIFINQNEVITNVERLSDEKLDKIFSGEAIEIGNPSEL